MRASCLWAKNAVNMVRVNLGKRSYDIVVASNDAAGLAAFARQRLGGALALVVTDEHVTAHAQAAANSLKTAGLRTETFVRCKKHAFFAGPPDRPIERRSPPA